MTHTFIPAGGEQQPTPMVPSDRRPGGVSEVARLLLAIVGPDRAAEVESVTSPGRGYLVPSDVAAEYRRRTEPRPMEPTQPEPEPAVVAEPAVAAEPTPAPTPEPDAVSAAVQRAIAAAARRPAARRPSKRPAGAKE